jgi:hypothetical protein
MELLLCGDSNGIDKSCENVVFLLSLYGFRGASLKPG